MTRFAPLLEAVKELIQLVPDIEALLPEGSEIRSLFQEVIDKIKRGL